MAKIAEWLNSQRGRYSILVALLLVASWVGIWWGAYVSGAISNGQRGGAVGVAITFFILFARREIGVSGYVDQLKGPPDVREQIVDILADKRLDPLTKEEMTVFATAVFERFKVEAAETTFQNFVLIPASIFTTVVWGFGDCASGWLQVHAPRGIWAALKHLFT
jgi:hypothetical protein